MGVYLEGCWIWYNQVVTLLLRALSRSRDALENLLLHDLWKSLALRALVLVVKSEKYHRMLGDARWLTSQDQLDLTLMGLRISCDSSCVATTQRRHNLSTLMKDHSRLLPDHI